MEENKREESEGEERGEEEKGNGVPFLDRCSVQLTLETCKKIEMGR